MSGQLLSEIGVAYFADMSKLEKAMQDADKTTQMLGNSAQKSAGVMSTAFESAAKSTQDLMQKAESAGLNVSKLASLQAKAGQAGAQLGVAQAKAAEALGKANAMEASGAASAEKIAVAQANAALAAEKVKVAETNAGSAMDKATAEANRLTSAMEQETSKSKSLASGAEGAGGKLEKMGAAAKSIAQPALIGLGIAVAAAGAALASTVKPGMDFQATMLKIQALAGLSKTDVAAAGDAILKMSSEVGKGPQDLAEGLYFIASAGFDAKDSMQILEVSAKAAAVGMTDTQTVANALTAALKAFPGMSVADAVDMMSKTVATGKTEWADYAGVVGEVSLAASQSGTRFVEANAAFAVLTNTMKSSEAATALKGLMEASSHVSDLTDRAKSLGLTFDANTYKSQTFLGRLQYLQTATDGNSESMKKLLGTDEAMAAISGLLTGGAQDYSKALDSIAESTGTAKSQFDTTSASAQAAWDRATASVQALQVKVGTALLPIITTFSDKIAPMVTRMLDWAEKNHVIENAINDLSSALSFIVTTGSNVIAFFQNNKAALIALGVVAVAVAGAITAAFIIWGISAAAAAIAQLGLIWPWLLLGAVVALVIAGVILAVLHWGDIVNWLSGVWGAFSGWFMGLLGGIGAFFTGLWTGIANFFTGLWAGIITGLQTAWNFIVSIVVAGAQFLLAAFMAPFVAIGAAFIWLYNHNIYFKALIDGIVSQVTTGLTWVSTQWQNFVAWLGMLWQGLVGFAANLWGQISGAIHDGFFAAIGFIVGVWTTISTVFSNAWSTYVSGPLTAMWTAVSTFFSGIWANYIAGPIGDLWNSISGAIGGWITSAIEWGGNLIQGFVNGIVAKAGNVASAVGGIAGQVLAFLGFHSPTKEGPGRFADQWAPAFVDMFASGIEQGVPRMEKALGNFIKPMAFDIKASTNAIGSSAPAAFATAPAMSASPVSATPVSATPTANNNSAPVYIVVHVEPPSVTLDKRELVDQVGEGVTRTLIRRTGVR